MKMKITVAVLLVLLAPVLSRTAQAVSFSPVPGENEEREAKGIRGKGEAVCLFQSGTAEIRKAVAVGDVLIVYRQGDGAPREVGKIRVLSFEGADYLRGKVAEGEVMNGDIAKKGDIASLVISSEERCKR